jgi:hypothetical protein
MAGKTVKCAKCGEAFRVEAADAPAPQQGPPAKSTPLVAKRLTPTPSGAEPARAPTPRKATLDDLLGGAASEAQGPAGAWESPVRPQKRAPPPLPAAEAEKPKSFERVYFNLAVVVIFLGLMTVCFAILGVNAKWLGDKTVAKTVAIVGTSIAGVALPLLLYAVRHNLLVGVPSALGVVAILAAAWVYQPFTRPDAPKKYQGPPLTWDPKAPRYVPPKTPPPAPHTPALPSDADKRLEELADETIARFAELNEALASARDAASAGAAIAKTMPLLRRVEELEQERRTLQSQGARLTPEKQQQLEAAQKAFSAQQLERLAQQAPQYLEQMDQLIKEVSPGTPPAKKQP